MELFGGEDLSRREDAALRAHLVNCMDCRRELRPVVRMHRALREAIPPAPACMEIWLWNMRSAGDSSPESAFSVGVL